MLKMQKFMKTKKGFTLVEVIVVLVILAILAAISIPSLTGYIDDAKGKAVIADARTVMVAMQAVSSSKYVSGAYAGTTDTARGTDALSDFGTVTGGKFGSVADSKVSKMIGSVPKGVVSSLAIGESNEIKSFVYTESGKKVTFTSGNDEPFVLTTT